MAISHKVGAKGGVTGICQQQTITRNDNPLPNINLGLLAVAYACQIGHKLLSILVCCCHLYHVHLITPVRGCPVWSTYQIKVANSITGMAHKVPVPQPVSYLLQVDFSPPKVFTWWEPVHEHSPKGQPLCWVNAIQTGTAQCPEVLCDH